MRGGLVRAANRRRGLLRFVRVNVGQLKNFGCGCLPVTNVTPSG